MRRVAECFAAADVRLRRYYNNASKIQQQWFFNGETNTIHSNNGSWKNYFIEIPGNGGQNNLKTVSGITSRWW
jgi:hypothetical protein